jgi:hypothetical protein
MALIISERPIDFWMGGVPYWLKDVASGFNIVIPSIYLSESYGLSVGDEVKGKISSLRKGTEEYPEFKHKAITFVLYPFLAKDYLFISKKEWEEDFRECGLIIRGFSLAVRLERAIKKKEGVEIPLYTKRDVEI